MSELQGSYKTRLAVIISAFLLVSSGLVPALSVSNESTFPSQPPGFLIFLSLFDPFLTVSSTRVAPAQGGALIQQQSQETPPSALSDSQSAASSFEIYGPAPSPSVLISMVAIIPSIWDESSKKRSRPQIYVEILELLKRGPMTPFEIAFYARLNHKRTKDYVRLLERSGYLESTEEDGRTLYSLSGNGKVIVERVRSIFESNQMATEKRVFEN